ncbi:MAG: YicC family protein [Tissierellia bacterium]|nr:YicC family protein [Tissierellia bacterium]
MLKSMTGFGRGESGNSDYNFIVEIKTVNHRYNDIVVRMPKHINYLEEKIKSVIKNKIRRGRVEVYIDLQYLNDSNLDIKIDMALAKSYKLEIDRMMKELNIKDEVKLHHMLMFPEIIKKEKKECEEDVIWQCLKIGLDDALDNVVDMRIKEGAILKKDMENQIYKIEENLLVIEKRAPMVILEYRDKLKTRVNELLDREINVDEDRLNYEIAFYADKSDINEEIVRLKSHSNQFLDSLNQWEPVGRKLDFILQEMNREINTIGSKSEDLIISNCVVNIKSELEKTREQVQNVE